jgi:Ca-activated chloride channel family protein
MNITFIERLPVQQTAVQKLFTVLFLLTIFFAISTMICSAQDKPDETISVGTELVSINVSVTDSKNRHIPNLTKEQFEVFDNKIKQEVAFFSGEESPLSIGIVYDVHSSSQEQTNQVLQSLKKFVATLRPEDDFFVMVFNERGSGIVDFVPTSEQISQQLTTGDTKGSKALYDAIFQASERIQKTRNSKKALLIISDGEDHQSRHSYKDVRAQISRFNIQVYGVGVTKAKGNGLTTPANWEYEDITRQTGRRTYLAGADESLGRAVIEEMSKVSGGSTYISDVRNDELLGNCTRIALEMRRQYKLSFYPTEETVGSKKWHKLNVRLTGVKDPRQVNLSYRKGYQTGQK